MSEEAKILLDRLESTARRLDRYIFLLIFLTISGGATFFPNSDPNSHATFLTIAVNDINFFRILLSFGLVLIFGMIGSNLIDYKSKRRDYVSILASSENKDIGYNLISRSMYEYVYNSNGNNDPSRKLAVVILAALLFVSNLLALTLIWKTTATYFYSGWITLIGTAIIIGLLVYSYVSTVKKLQ